MNAYELAKEAYDQMYGLYNYDYEDIDGYINIAEKYANIKNIQQNETISIVWEKNGGKFDMYNSFVHIPSDYNRFLEDLTMMIYRLHGGEGYNTYGLIKDLKR